jgi:Icc-related predicted phosphoesterase
VATSKHVCRGVIAAMSICCFCLDLRAVQLAAPPAADASAGRAFSPFVFALFGDPQIGYGRGGTLADSERFSEVIARANGSAAELVVIPGDLVQANSIWQRWAFARTSAKIQTPLLLTPGNHDVTDLASLEKYREVFGNDYHDFVHNDCAFVLVNSETARSQAISAPENAAQWRWLESTLRAHSDARRSHVLLVTHRPPFAGQEDEPDDEANWPRPARARLLELARQHGVRWILSGHLHRTVTVSTDDGIQVVALAGTSRSFDRSPLGYAAFTVEQNGIRQEFVQVAPAPEPPFSVPGLGEWTPRLFEFSPRHWLFTFLYGAAAFAALRFRRRLIFATKTPSATTSVWGWIGVLMAWYAVNMQLDFDELLREVGRVGAKLAGFHQLRHVITGAGLSIFLFVSGGVVAVRHLQARRELGARSARTTTLATACLGFPTAWFCLSAISHHDLGMLFDEGWWDLLNAASCVGVIACTLPVLNGVWRAT